MIRVRGIYSTSLVGLLDEFGFTFSDITEKVKERIKHVRGSDQPVTVTVKDLEDRKGVVVIGESELVRTIAYDLAVAVPESFVVYMESGPYTSMTVRVLEKLDGELYRVELPEGQRGILRARRPINSGTITAAHIIRPDPAEPFLCEGVAVVGHYVRLVQYEKHSISEHIRDYERASELLSLAQMIAPEGWGVKFRSSAGKAPLIEIMSEVKQLVEKGIKLQRESTELREPSYLARGEALAFVHFSPTASVTLDKLRSRYFPTISLHHLLKSLGSQKVSEDVDELESKESLREDIPLLLYIEQIGRLLRAGTVTLVHRKLQGRHHTWVARAAISADGFLLLSRAVHSEGIYDGTGIPKNIGDNILSVTWPLSRTIAHFYFSSKGEFKGAYVNINTPLDFILDPRPAITYIDLQIDVVRTAESVQVVDESEFYSLVGKGVILERDASCYKCLTQEVAEILGKTDSPTDVAWALLDAQSKCFKEDQVEELKTVILEKLRGLDSGRALRTVENEVYRVR